MGELLFTGQTLLGNVVVPSLTSFLSRGKGHLRGYRALTVGNTNCGCDTGNNMRNMLEMV